MKKILLLGALLCCSVGCSGWLAEGGELDARVGLARDAYMATLSGGQKLTCEASLASIEHARQTREDSCVFIEFDCERAQRCYSGKGQAW